MVIDMKYVACSRLETMFHLEFQKGKEAMKTLEFKNILEELMHA